jgi:hypothetical protein
LSSAQGAHLPNARQLADRVICLPIYPGLSDAQIQSIVELLSSPTKHFAKQVEPIDFVDLTPSGITSFKSFENFSDPALVHCHDLSSLTRAAAVN